MTLAKVLGWKARSRSSAERSSAERSSAEEVGHVSFVERFVDLIPSPVFYKDASGVYRVCNSAFERLVGRPRREVLGKTARDIFPPEPAVDHERHDQALWASGRIQSYSYPFKATDGGDRLGLFRKALIRDADGTPTGLIGIVTDITDLTCLQEEMRRSEEWFRALTEHALDMVAVISADARIRFVSSSVEQILGWTPAQLDGSSLFAFVHPEDAASARQAIARNLTAEPGQEQLVELRFRNRDDSWRTLEVIGKNRLDDPSVRGIVVNARDITKRRRAEDKLHQNEERFRGVVENMPALLVAASDDFVPLAWNHECERVTGWTAGEVIGNPNAFHTLIPEGAERRRLRDRYLGGRSDSLEIEVNVTCRDGSVRTISWSSLYRLFPIAGWAIWGIGRDVTAEKQAHRAVAAASRLVATRMLSGGVARNIENLVAVTEVNATRLSAQTSDVDVKTSLAEIIRTAQRAARLAQQLTHYAEQPVAAGTTTNVDESVLGGLEIAEGSTLGSGVEFKLDLNSQGTLIEANPAQITQLVAYLVTNATEAITGTGKVSVGTCAVWLPEEDKAAPSTLKSGRYVRLTVQDTGCGIDRQAAPRIFEPFFTTKADGLGLGLAAVHGIVRAHNGAIAVSSRAGEGSTFTVYLPALTGKS